MTLSDKQTIQCLIDNMIESIIDRQAGEVRPKKAAALGAQVTILRTLRARVDDIDIS